MKYTTFITASIFCCFSLLQPVAAQSPHPSFRPYTVDDGLPSSEVYQVKQDSKGYIWFATGNGVSRFNGYEFENFSMSNGLPDNTVFEIFEDSTGRIWFLPISCRLSYYYRGKIYPYKFNDILQKKLNNPIKSSFAVRADGTVFLGVFRDGIYEISPFGVITHHALEKEKGAGAYVLQPGTKDPVVSTASLKTSNLVHFNTMLLKGDVRIDNDVNISGSTLRCITTKKKLTLLTCNNSLYIFKDINDYKVKTFPNRLIWIYEDQKEDLWIGTYLGGVFHFPKGNLDEGHNYLPGMPVNGLLQDKEGCYWFATEGNGAFYSLSNKVMVYDESIGLGNNRVNCLATDGTSVYAGIRNGKIHKIRDSIVKTFGPNPEPSGNNTISALYYDSIDQRMLVSGKANGYIVKDKFIRDPTLGNFNKVVMDNRNYWVATSMYLDYVGSGKREILLPKDGCQLKRINALVEDPHKNLLIGTVDGLWLFDKKLRNFTYIGNRDPLLSTRILDLAYAGKLLVIATKGKGILIYDNKRVYQIDSKRGLCGDNVYRIFIADSSIWAATNKGVNRITILKKEPLLYDIKKFTTADGLSSNEINDVLVLGGETWAATNKGVNVFNGSIPLHDDVNIPFYIEAISVNDQKLPPADHYELEYDQNNLIITYIGLGYKDAGKLQYMYRLNGLDTAWARTQGREIRFNTLPPDNYRLEIRVLNAGSDCKGVLLTTFTIKAPFWQKWWFRLSAILLVIYLAYYFFRYRIDLIRQREMKNAELNKTLMSLKLKALRAQMNPHFTFNVMNSIQHFILNKEEEAAHRYLSKFSRLIRAILNNSENNTIPLAEELKALELYIELETMRFENSFEYEISIGNNIDPTSIFVPSMLIQPYVENAIKHGLLPLKQGGKLKVSIIRQDSLLKCIIEDNGIGRKKAAEQQRDETHRSIGMSLTQERLTVINELNNSNLSERIIDLTDESGNASGTKVEIYIPIG